jgi:hypothetical protein
MSYRLAHVAQTPGWTASSAGLANPETRWREEKAKEQE